MFFLSRDLKEKERHTSRGIYVPVLTATQHSKGIARALVSDFNRSVVRGWTSNGIRVEVLYTLLGIYRCSSGSEVHLGVEKHTPRLTALVRAGCADLRSVPHQRQHASAIQRAGQEARFHVQRPSRHSSFSVIVAKHHKTFRRESFTGRSINVLDDYGIINTEGVMYLKLFKVF